LKDFIICASVARGMKKRCNWYVLYSIQVELISAMENKIRKTVPGMLKKH
jgi:hypothetical protein